MDNCLVCPDCNQECTLKECKLIPRSIIDSTDYHHGCQCCGRTFMMGWYGIHDRYMLGSDQFVYAEDKISRTIVKGQGRQIKPFIVHYKRRR